MTMKKISLVLCFMIILGSITGCVVKRVGGSGATGESSPEVSSEVSFETTKENTSENILTTQEKTPENKEEIKNSEKAEEPTPEFYDFMTLDPEPEKRVNSPQEYYSIGGDLAGKWFDYEKTGKVTFTKKEVYYCETYYIQGMEYSELSLYFKHGKSDFYSQKTKEKLDNLGFKFSDVDTTFYGIKYLSEINPKNYGKYERIEELKTAMKIILEDHNVAYANLYSLEEPD